MKTLCLCASALFAICSLAAAETYPPGLAREYLGHPLRKIGDTLYDFHPLYQYWTRDPDKSRQIRPPLLHDWRIHRFRVHQIFTDGLLVTVEEHDADQTRRYILRHHPRQSEIVDRDLTTLLVYKLPGRTQYHTVEGSLATVEQFDYGIPVDPPEAQK